jgi:hypothetical protein
VYVSWQAGVSRPSVGSLASGSRSHIEVKGQIWKTIIWRNFIDTCVMASRCVASHIGVYRFKVKVTHSGQMSNCLQIIIVRAVTTDPLKIIWRNFIHTCIMTRRCVASYIGVYRFKVTHRGERSNFVQIILVRTVTSDPLKIIWRSFIDMCIMRRRGVASHIGISRVNVTHTGQRSN